MIQISNSLQTALNATSNRPVNLYELYLDSGTHYYADQQIDWNGNTYLPYVKDRSGVKRFMGAQFDNVTVTFTNVDTAMAQLLRTNEIEGKRLIIRLIDQTVFDDSVVLFNGLMNRASQISTETVQISAVQLLAYIDSKVPARQFTVQCPWPFKGEECQYSGAETTCDHSWARCSQLGNTPKYGGFRFVPQSGSYSYQTTETKRSFLFLKRKSTKTITAAFNSADDTPYGTPLPIILGRTQIAAAVIEHVDQGAVTKALAAFCAGPVERIFYIRANQSLAPDVLTHIGQYGGQGSQLVDPRFPESYQYNLVAYAGVTIPSDVQTVDPAPTISAVVQGLKVQIWGAGGTFLSLAWSDNPAFCTRSFMQLSAAQGGLGMPESWFDDAVTYDTAQYCDAHIQDATGMQTIYEPTSLPGGVVVGEGYKLFRSSGIVGGNPTVDGPYVEFLTGVTDDSSVSPTILTTKRFTLNLALAKESTAVDALYKKMLSAFRGYITYSKAGKIQIKAERAVWNSTLSATSGVGATAISMVDNAAVGDLLLIGAYSAQAEVARVTSGGLASPLQFAHIAGDKVYRIDMAFDDSNMIGGFQYPMADRQDSINRVNVVFVNAPGGFVETKLEVNDYDHQALVRKINSVDYDASGADSFSQAYRLGQWYLAKMRQLGKFCQFTADIKATLLEIGDVIAVTAVEAGLKAVPFQVTELEFLPNDEVQITGQIYEVGIYSDVAPRASVNVPSVFNIITNTTALTADEVTPLAFGAIGDGVADDTTAVRQAVGTSKAVRLPAGKTFLVQDILVDGKNDFKLIGKGALKLKNATNKALLTFKNCSNLVIDGPDLDGNKAGQTGFSNGLYLSNCPNATIESVHVHDSNAFGFIQEVAPGTKGARMANCRSTGHVYDGYHFRPTPAPLGPSYASNDTFNQGLPSATALTAGDFLLSSCEASGNGEYGLQVLHVDAGVVTSFNSHNNASHGIWADGAKSLLADGGKINSNTGYGLAAQFCDDMSLQGNDFTGNTAGPTNIVSTTYIAYNNRGLDDRQLPTPVPGPITNIRTVVVDYADAAIAHITGLADLPTTLNRFDGCETYITVGSSEPIPAGHQSHEGAGPFRFEFRIGRPAANETWRIFFVSRNSDAQSTLAGAPYVDVAITARAAGSGGGAVAPNAVSITAVGVINAEFWGVEGVITWPTDKSAIDRGYLRIIGPAGADSAIREFAIVVPPATGNTSAYSTNVDWLRATLNETWFVSIEMYNSDLVATAAPVASGNFTIAPVSTSIEATNVIATRVLAYDESGGEMYGLDISWKNANGTDFDRTEITVHDITNANDTDRVASMSSPGGVDGGSNARTVLGNWPVPAASTTIRVKVWTVTSAGLRTPNPPYVDVLVQKQGTGNIDLSRASAFSIGEGLGNIGGKLKIPASGVTDSMIGSVSASKITAGTIAATVILTSPVLDIFGPNSSRTHIDTSVGILVTNYTSGQSCNLNRARLDVAMGSLFGSYNAGRIFLNSSYGGPCIQIQTDPTFGSSLIVANASTGGAGAGDTTQAAQVPSGTFTTVKPDSVSTQRLIAFNLCTFIVASAVTLPSAAIGYFAIYDLNGNYQGKVPIIS